MNNLYFTKQFFPMLLIRHKQSKIQNIFFIQQKFIYLSQNFKKTF